MRRSSRPATIRRYIEAYLAAQPRHILHMAFQALRRGILNQHVLPEIGAFAGMPGGVIGPWPDWS